MTSIAILAAVPGSGSVVRIDPDRTTLASGAYVRRHCIHYLVAGAVEMVRRKYYTGRHPTTKMANQGSVAVA